MSFVKLKNIKMVFFSFISLILLFKAFNATEIVSIFIDFQSVWFIVSNDNNILMFLLFLLSLPLALFNTKYAVGSTVLIVFFSIICVLLAVLINLFLHISVGYTLAVFLMAFATKDTKFVSYFINNLFLVERLYSGNNINKKLNLALIL